jgi:hypothetical protein
LSDISKTIRDKGYVVTAAMFVGRMELNEEVL